MKKLWFTIILTVFFLHLNAQRLKYQQINQVILSGENDTAIALLEKYISQNPEEPNAYVQLALLLSEKLYSTDFLADTTTHYLLYKTENYFKKALSLLKTKKNSVKKNKKFYQNIPELAKFKKINNELVINFLTAKYKKFLQFEKQVNISLNFNLKAQKNYFRCQECYKNLHKKFPSYTSLVFAPDSQVFPYFDTLKRFYDSTIFYFQKFKIFIKTTQLLKKNYILTPLKIQNYQTDGFTAADFSADTIKIWNYKTWAMKTEKQIKTQMKSVKEKVNSIYKQLSEIQKIIAEKRNYPGDIPSVKEIVKELKAIDSKSLLIPFLTFIEAKVKYLFFYNSLSKENPISRNLELYVYFKNYLDKASEQILILDKKNNPVAYKNNYDFFNANFGSFGNFTNYIKQEIDTIKKLKNTSPDEFLALINQSYFPPDSIHYNCNGISVTPYSDSSSQKFKTSFFVWQGQVLYIFGTQQTSSYFTPFYAKIEHDSCLEFKQLQIKNYKIISTYFDGSEMWALLENSDNQKIVNLTTEKILDLNVNFKVSQFAVDTAKQFLYLFGSKTVTNQIYDSLVAQICDFDCNSTFFHKTLTGKAQYFDFQDNKRYKYVFLNSERIVFDGKEYAGISIFKINKRSKILSFYNIPTDFKGIKTYEYGQDKYAIFVYRNTKKIENIFFVDISRLTHFSLK